jgi:hypothetical protein
LLAIPTLGRDWDAPVKDSGPNRFDGDDRVVLELIPGGSPIQKDREVRL